MVILEKDYAYSGIRNIRTIYNKIADEDVLQILEQYAKAELIDAIKRLGLLDIKKLGSLIVWLTRMLGLRVSGVDLVEEPETGQPQFIAVYIEDCGWDEWRRLSRQVKKQLVDEGLDDVAGKVALVCSEAL